MDHSENDGSTTKEFALFRELAVELRLKIWDLALPEPRVITIEIQHNNSVDEDPYRLGGLANNKYVLVNSPKPPVHIQVNCEARFQALKTYHLAFHSGILGNKPKYFNFSKDTLHIKNLFNIWERHYLPKCIQDLEKVQKVKLSGGGLLYGSRENIREALNPFVALESLVVEMEFDSDQPANFWDKKKTKASESDMNSRFQETLERLWTTYESNLDISCRDSEREKEFRFYPRTFTMRFAATMDNHQKSSEIPRIGEQMAGCEQI